MINLFLLILLCSLTKSTLTCQSGKTYIKITKKNGYQYADEESHTISDGASELITSLPFVNDELRVTEYCVDSSINDQYTLRLIDRYGDSWTSGSWIEIKGFYDNIVFKAYLTERKREEYNLSLYIPIMLQKTWKITSTTVSGEWTTVSYPETNWVEAVLGSVTTAVSGTQYFRKTFTGIANMAAYELRMKYRFGLIAYINGMEIIRENMPAEPVTSTTHASGSYPTLELRGFIRTGSDVSASSSVLAIELHWREESPQTVVDFDAWLALYGPSSLNTIPCYSFGYSVTTTANTGSNPEYANNWIRDDNFYLYPVSSGSNAVLTMSIPGLVIPYVNAIRIWPSVYPVPAPKDFVLAGKRYDNFQTVIAGNDLIYASSAYMTKYTIFNSGSYNTYRMTVTETGTSYLYLFEMQLQVCNLGQQSTIVFEPNTISIFEKYESVSIHPVINEYLTCQITPNPPEGLVFNSATCTLTGYSMSSVVATSYTVTSTMNGILCSGSFTLEIKGCSGVMADANVVYKLNSVYQYFSIVDESNQEVIYSIDYNAGQVDNVETHTFLCLTSPKYKVTLTSGISSWYPESFLYIKLFLSSEDNEVVRRMKYESMLGLPTVFHIQTLYAIHSYQQWEYKVDGTIPNDWTGTTVTGWQQASAGTFPTATKQIQLFRKTFNVADLGNSAGVVLSLQYKYGCVVYLNGNEVFHNGVTALTETVFSTNIYTDVSFHQISLPVKTMTMGTTPGVNYINQGSNVIAVALISQTAAQTTVDFDCAIRLMGEAEVTRLFSYSLSSSGVTSPQYMFSHYYYWVTSGSSATNNVVITFDNDRREWISSIGIQNFWSESSYNVKSFSIEARESSSSSWVTLKTIVSTTWSFAGQFKKVWLVNNTPYNQYRFSNFNTGSTTEPNWKVNRIELYSDNTIVTVPDLSYTGINIIYKDVELAEIYPNSPYYSDFTIQPNLPNGVYLDFITGQFSGTAKTEMESKSYTISAIKFAGGPVTVTFNLAVSICTGTESLITMTVRTDGYPKEGSYKLYKGRDNTGEVKKSIAEFPMKNTLYYADWCLPHDMYMVEAIDKLSDGWSAPGGYMLTVDIGTMRFDMNQLPNTGSAPVIVSTIFSSFLPFQKDYDKWSLYKSTDPVATDWNSEDFNDLPWGEAVKASNIGQSEAVTVYVRHSFTLSSIENYNVLNVRVRYSGGIAAYFNHRLVARFNLEDSFDSSTPSITVHDSDVFSKFHIILSTAGVRVGKNVMAFEIHRPVGQPSSSNIQFDATGVFGVMDCSIVTDTFASLNGTTPLQGKNEDFFDLCPFTYGYQPMNVGTFFEWQVENLEGSKFNSYGVFTAYMVNNWGFSLYGRKSVDTVMTNMHEITNASTKNMGKTTWEVPVGIAGFTNYKFEYDASPNSNVSINSYIFEYCAAKGDGICKADGDYPAVGNEQVSPGPCPLGFTGYSYKTCSNGVLGETQLRLCVHKAPLRLKYSSDRYTFVKDIAVVTPAPTYVNIIEAFYMDENVFLPEGLELNRATGAIEGTPTKVSEISAYTIYGKNPRGVTSKAVNISIRKGECKPDGDFTKTYVGVVAEFECELKGSFVGTLKRSCVLGKEDGEWLKASGVCMSTTLLAILIIAAVVIVIAVIVIIVRVSAKPKAITGPSARKASSVGNKKNLEKKGSAKTIKV